MSIHKITVDTSTEFKAPFLEAKYLKKHNTVEYKWIGHLSDVQAQIGLEKIRQMVKVNQAINLLADITEFTGGSVTTAKWVNDVWSDQLREAGLKFVAVNVPKSAFGVFSNMVALGEKFNRVLKVEKFDSLENAYKWFAQQTPVKVG